MSEDLTKKFSESDKLNLILTAVQRLESSFEKLETRVEDIDARLQRLEQKVEERLYDTRPIWQSVLAAINQLQEGQQRLENEVREIRTSLRDTARRMSIFNDMLISIQADYRDIYDRIRRLELGSNPPTNSQT